MFALRHILKVVHLSFICLLLIAFTAVAEQPKLVLQITVDSLRGDLLSRYDHVFGEGGFRYLQKRGIQYKNAHFQHANTETIVGHASLATGAGFPQRASKSLDAIACLGRTTNAGRGEPPEGV